MCRNPDDTVPRVEVVNRANDADVASTLVHEYTHARLHDGEDDETERAKREVEAESTAYVSGTGVRVGSIWPDRRSILRRWRARRRT